MKFANLHLHSTYSDACFTPEQLVLIGKALGYKALALTDHETDGGVRSFMKYAKAEGIESVSGVEFEGKEDGVSLHLTALDFDMDDPGIRRFIEERCQLRMEATRKCVERGIRLGYIQELSWQDVLDFSPEGAWFCIDSVMNVMKMKKVVDDYFDWDAFRANVFKAPEAKSFHPKSATAEEVIRVVRNAGGIVALAHPNHQTQYIERLVGYGLNGVEVCHPNLDDEQSRLAMDAANTFHLYCCGGTDHTGPMSGCGGDRAVPVFHGITEEEFTIMKQRKLG